MSWHLPDKLLLTKPIPTKFSDAIEYDICSSAALFRLGYKYH